jgi:two-component system response regulator MprA
MAIGKVLVVEDDAELRGVLLRGLREEGFDAEGAGSGGEALERVNADPPDVLVLDIGLPDADGRDVCQALRARGMDAPVLFLTARDTLTDRITGFNAGGDDYVAKPFAFAEIVARLEALLRRRARGDHDLHGLELDPAAHAAFVDGVKVPLTPTEYRLLGRLLADRGRAVRRHELVRTGWPHGAAVRENTLDAYIARIRRKLEPFASGPEIVTVHGVGYTIE